MSIGDKVRATRKAAGISQEEVARRAGVSLNVINRLERGVILDPHYSTLRGIASALGVPVEDLVREPALAGKADAPERGSSVDSTEEVITFDDEAVRAAISAAKAGKLTTKEAAQAIADSVRGGPADALEDAVELLLEQAEREHSEDREGAKT